MIQDFSTATLYSPAPAAALAPSGAFTRSAGEEQERVDLRRFLPQVAETLGSKTAARLHEAVWESDCEPASILDLLTLLRARAEGAWRELHLRLSNSYVNAELGAERDAYIAVLRRRFAEADSLFRDIAKLALRYNAA